MLVQHFGAAQLTCSTILLFQDSTHVKLWAFAPMAKFFPTPTHLCCIFSFIEILHGKEDLFYPAIFQRNALVCNT